MGKLIAQCPSCKNVNLHTTKIECMDCNTTFEGKFEIPTLLKISEEDVEFILDFVKCSGSLKDMAAKQNISYPTLRNRLNILIETLENLKSKKEVSKIDILKDLEEGNISVKDAVSLLQKL